MLVSPGLPLQAGHTLFKTTAWQEERDRGEMSELYGRKNFRAEDRMEAGSDTQTR